MGGRNSTIPACLTEGSACTTFSFFSWQRASLKSSCNCVGKKGTRGLGGVGLEERNKTEGKGRMKEKRQSTKRFAEGCSVCCRLWMGVLHRGLTPHCKGPPQIILHLSLLVLTSPTLKPGVFHPLSVFLSFFHTHAAFPPKHTHYCFCHSFLPLTNHWLSPMPCQPHTYIHIHVMALMQKRGTQQEKIQTNVQDKWGGEERSTGRFFHWQEKGQEKGWGGQNSAQCMAGGLLRLSCSVQLNLIIIKSLRKCWIICKAFNFRYTTDWRVTVLAVGIQRINLKSPLAACWSITACREWSVLLNTSSVLLCMHWATISSKFFKPLMIT